MRRQTKHSTNLQAQSRLPPYIKILYRQLPTVNEIQVLRTYVPRVFLTRLPCLQLQHNLRALHRRKARPLQGPPCQNFKQGQCRRIPYQTTFQLQTRLYITNKLSTVLTDRKEHSSGKNQYTTCEDYPQCWAACGVERE